MVNPKKLLFLHKKIDDNPNNEASSILTFLIYIIHVVLLKCLD